MGKANKRVKPPVTESQRPGGPEPACGLPVIVKSDSRRYLATRKGYAVWSPCKEVHIYGFMKAPTATTKPFSIHQAIISLYPRKPQRVMLQIEWKSSHYHSNGRRRSRPKASTVHGWLVKWRATFSGNERLRKEGIREMREAKAVRDWKKQQKAARLAKAGTSNCLFWPITFGEKKKRQLQASKTISRGARTSSAKRPSSGGTRHQTSPAHSRSPTFVNSRRPSLSRRESGNRHHDRNVRKASHSSSNSRGHKGSVRTSKKER